MTTSTLFSFLCFNSAISNTITHAQNQHSTAHQTEPTNSQNQQPFPKQNYDAKPQARQLAGEVCTKQCELSTGGCYVSAAYGAQIYNNTPIGEILSKSTQCTLNAQESVNRLDQTKERCEKTPDCRWNVNGVCEPTVGWLMYVVSHRYDYLIFGDKFLIHFSAVFSTFCLTIFLQFLSLKCVC